MIAAVSVAGLSSCLKDSLDGCPDDQGYAFRLTVTPDYSRNSPSDWYNIGCVHVYIFDDQNQFVTCEQAAAYSGQPYVFNLDYLAPGEYQFVAWTNCGDIYKANIPMEQCHANRPSIDDLQLYFDNTQAGCLTTDIPDLHHGILTGAVAVADEYNHYTLVVRPITYRINITVKGFPDNGDDYGFDITDNNSHYYFDFDNQNNLIVPSQGDFTYTRTSAMANSEIKASIKVLKLQDGRTPQFVFGDAAEEFYSGDLIQMIRLAYQANGQTVDFEAIHTYDIVLTYDTNMNVRITVNGWRYTGQSGDLG